MNKKLRVLHLSDFHFIARPSGSEDNATRDEPPLREWQRRATLTALLAKLRELKAEGLGPDLVCLTGDIANHGKREEFQEAERYFHKVAEVLELEPRERFFVVPGNHDVDRSKVTLGDTAIQAALTDSESVASILDDRGVMTGVLGRRLEEFYAFTERLCGSARAWPLNRPWHVVVPQVNGIRVGMVQLNSAWTSGQAGEDGSLVIGEVQVYEALQEAEDAHVTFVLVHHPLEALQSWDRLGIRRLMMGPMGTHFLFRGHYHENEVLDFRVPGGEGYTELAAGATYPGTGWRKHFYLLSLDFEAGSGKLRSFEYSSGDGGFWAPDTRSHRAFRSGGCVFALPGKKMVAEGKRNYDGMTIGKVRFGVAVKHYRAAVAAVHGAVRFVGFGDSSPRPNVQVEQLFVPMRLVWRGAARQHDLSTQELLSRLLTSRRPNRLVVLGDPGSGKTTLCRFLASAIAGGVPGLQNRSVFDDSELLPLFLPFRDYVREQRKDSSLSLVDYLYRQATGHLQVPLPNMFFQQILVNGGAVMLLDGLDEVGSAGEREEMRVRVVAFCRLYERVPVLVTSRIAGYDQAPLQSSDGMFPALQLAAFSNVDLKLFVRNWYRLVEAGDVRAQDEGATELLAAFAADPRVQELARNPMLATLIALVHRYEAHLPGERAKLYELCVKTMLETWPAARRMQFLDIDEGLQRFLLEQLAFRMQERRSHGDDGEVSTTEEQLILDLTEIASELLDVGSYPPGHRHLVRRWVRFLQEGTGLLVEQQLHVFSFFHLSLLEYLSACGLERQAYQASQELAREVAARFVDPVWREVCLLTVGVHAVDKGFLDNLFEEVAGRSGSWSFLLACLREEANFSASQRSKILDGAARDLLDRDVGTWEMEQRMFDELLRFSRRHHAAARAWLAHQMERREASLIQGAIALRLHRRSETLAELQVVAKPEVIAPALLDFWPSELGRWATNVLPTEEVLQWAYQGPPELAVHRSLTALAMGSVGKSCYAPLAVSIIRRSLAGLLSSLRSTDCLRNDLGGNGTRLPAAFRLSNESIDLVVVPSWPKTAANCRPADDEYFERPLARHVLWESFDYCSWLGYESARVSTFERFLLDAFPKYFSAAFGRNFRLWFEEYFLMDHETILSSEVAHRFACDFMRYFAGQFGRYFTRYNEKRFRLEFLNDRDNILVEPASESRSAELEIREGACRLEGKDSAEGRHAGVVLTRLASEAWLAMVATHDEQDRYRLMFIHYRVFNCWLLTIWHRVDVLRVRVPQAYSWTDDATALYLALGWTQATTTHQWPATDTWIEQVSQRPDHWFPRSQWHLCYLLHNPDDPEHQEGYRQALAEGESDKERPGLAGILRELVPV